MPAASTRHEQTQLPTIVFTVPVLLLEQAIVRVSIGRMATAEGSPAAAEKATAVATKKMTTATTEASVGEDAAMVDAALLADGEDGNENSDDDNNEADADADANNDDSTEPLGPRAGRLQALFDSSLRHTLAKISWANFAACYPTAAARSPAALQTVHGALVARLGELCGAEFAAVLRARDVVRKLNALERLAEEARARREAAKGSSSPAVVPPHTLPPETILAAHLRPQRRAQREMLEDRLRSVQAANAARFAQLTAQQAEAERLVGGLEQALADAAAAAALLEGKEGGAAEAASTTTATTAGPDGEELVMVLARETRAAEMAMSGM